MKAGNSRVLRTILLILITIILCPFAYGKTIYVDDDAAGKNDGSSWENAYVYLQDALADANATDKPVEIRVAQGIYKPNEGLVAIPEFDERTTTFQLVNGATLKGGYMGYGAPDPDKRDIYVYETILSGDQDGNDDGVDAQHSLENDPVRAENSYHVVTGSGTDSSAVLDGFTVTGGYDNRSELTDEFWIPDGLGGPWEYPVGQGAGMYNSAGGPTVMRCTFQDNFASAEGGGIYNDHNSNPILSDCTFKGNVAHFVSSDSIMPAGKGGGICNYSSSPVVTNCTYIGNYACYGGGMYNGRDSTPRLTNCTFSENSADWEGGGMENYQSSPILDKCIFSRNSTDRGGGMYNHHGDAIITECMFRDNKAYFFGGGVYNSRSSPTLTTCTFRNNSASISGGGMNNFIDCDPILSNCIFIRNLAIDDGGGMENHRSSPILTDCTFSENWAGDYGGGISSSRDSDAVLTNCKVVGNEASFGGGVDNSGSRPILTNCIFSGNSALEYGGGMRNGWDARPILTNCTFARNSAENGNALACASSSSHLFEYPPSDVVITNCIIWDGGSDVYNDDGSTITITYCNVEDGLAGDGNIDVEPLFVEPGYWVHVEDTNVVVEPNDPNAVWVDGDYHLKSEYGRWNSVSESWVVDDVTSPCIDAGDPNSPVGDEPEPNGGRINMGAYGGTAEASKSRDLWWFETTQGAIAAEGLGVILPHEHIFTDLRGPATRGYGQADAADVVRVMAPYLEEAKQKGVGLLFECSSIGVGRNVSILSEVSTASGLPVVVPTGVYGRADFAPVEHKNMSEDELTELFISEIREGIDGTSIKAGFIKIATGGSNMTALEEKFLRAAGRAAQETGAAVASHTTVSSNVTKQVDILESISPEIRFIWVHAQSVNNRSLYQQLAERGVFIEFDSLGWNPGQDSTFITAIKDLLAAGYGEKILLSHDAGWYQPGEQNGGTQMPYTYLIETFIPKLRNSGVDDEAIRMIIEINPIRAFGFNQDVSP